MTAETEDSTVDPQRVESSPSPDADRLESIEARLDELEAQNAALRGAQEELQADNEDLQAQIDRNRRVAVRLGGYLDTGLFWAQGNGAGIRSDFGHRLFPEYAGVVPDSWVFVGDPLSTAINARGEPADTGDSRAIAFDSVDSGGEVSFIVNSVNLGILAALGEQVFAETLVAFVPRGRDVSQTDGLFLGDYIDLKLAYLSWNVPVRRFDLELTGGKIDPVFGREYRIQESPDRIEVTPSLLCRYTCGRPIGFKARALFLDRSLVFALSLTNGSSYQETFAFYDEVDSNEFKTVAGRASFVLPVGAGLEIGASGQFGAQDLQPHNDVFQWQAGFDAHLDFRGLEVTAEFLHGRADGRDIPSMALCSGAPCLRVIGAYGTLGYRALNWLMPFVRADWRDAVHQSGADFVYITQTTRITPGVRFEVGEHVIIKAQYTVNLEVDRVPQIPNDTFTSSFVAWF